MAKSARTSGSKPQRSTGKASSVGATAKPKAAGGEAKVKNLSPAALEAAKQFGAIYRPKTLTKLKGKNAGAIRKAVRGYYLA